MERYNYVLDYSRIKTLRQNFKINQKTIATYLNISIAAYSQFERMTTLITIEKLNELANYYNVSLDYLVNISDNPNIIIKNKELNKKLIGERLKNIRKEKHLYQDTLAKEIGTGHSLISEYESGKRLISLSYGYAICKKYNISMDYLYGKI